MTPTLDLWNREHAKIVARERKAIMVLCAGIAFDFVSLGAFIYGCILISTGGA